MLHLFRQKGITSVVYGAIVVGLILVFVLGFSPTAGKKLATVSETCTARVRGSCIDPKAHKAAFRLVFARGTTMKQQMASRIVLEGLIERELLAMEADRLGLTVAEQEITNSIFEGDLLVSLPADNPSLARQLGFVNGKQRTDLFKNKETKQFDMKTYERNLRSLTNRSPAEFREWQARELLAAKMRDLVKAPVRVSDDEAFDRYVVQRTTAQLGYVVVRKGWVEKYAMATDPAVVDAWAKNKDNLKKVKSSVRHVLIGTRGKSGEEKDQLKAKAEDILARAKKGEDFGKLAKEFSEDPGSKDKGGQYAGDMVEHFVEPFKKAYYDLAPGEITPTLVETDFGWHVIKKDEATREEITKAFKESKSGDIAKSIAEKILASMNAGKTAEEASKEAIAEFGKYTPPKPEKPKTEGDAGAPAQETYTADTDPERPQALSTSPFNRGATPIPAVSSSASAAVVTFAFEAKPGEVVKEPVATDDGFIIAQLKEIKPATREDFDKERDMFKLDLLEEKQNEALAHYVKRLRDAAKHEIKVDEKNMFGAPQGDGGASSGDDDEL